MEILLFTKLFKDCKAEAVGDAAITLGVDGLDLAVRYGQCVSPANVAQELPRAMQLWAEMGLSVPLVTLEGYATGPQAPEVQAIYAACGEAGIGLIKLGYWRWKPYDDYWQGVAQIRHALDGFAKLGERHNVCSLIHTHSGDLYFSNAAAAMHVARGFDPDRIGVYLDFAHLAADGESVPMAQAIVGQYLRMIGVKNVRYVQERDGKWKKEFCALEEGLVDWEEALKEVRDSGYQGPISLHAEYDKQRNREGNLRMAAHDMKYLRPRTCWLK